MSHNRQCTGHAAVVGFLLKEMLQPPHQSHRVNRNCLNLALVYLGMPLASTLSQSRGCSPTDSVLVSGRSPAMPAYGTFRTWCDVGVESAFGVKPDLTIAVADFRVSP